MQPSEGHPQPDHTAIEAVVHRKLSFFPLDIGYASQHLLRTDLLTPPLRIPLDHQITVFFDADHPMQDGRLIKPHEENNIQLGGTVL
jgi:hypothetical protein